MIGIQISAQVALQVYRNIAFCSSRTDPDPFLQLNGMQIIRYNTVCHTSVAISAQAIWPKFAQERPEIEVQYRMSYDP